MARQAEWVYELEKILNEFEDEEEEIIVNTYNSVANETKDKVKSNAKAKFKGSDYASTWEVKKGGSLARGKYNVTVCNPKNYQLTHLLEKGHQSLNQYGGPYKRVRGRRHIKPAEKWGTEQLIKRLREEL